LNLTGLKEFTLSKEDLREYWNKWSNYYETGVSDLEYDQALLKLKEGLHTDLQNGLSLHDDLHHRAKV